MSGRNWEAEAARIIGHMLDRATQAVRHSTVDGTATERAIANARGLLAEELERLARPRPGHVIDDQGVERPVMGELPQTADGHVIGYGEWNVWYLRGNGREVVSNLASHTPARGWSGPLQWHGPKLVYATREAAERAARGEP